MLSPEFAKVVPEIQKLSANRPQVEVFLFPQGEPEDERLTDKLRELGWNDPYMLSWLSRMYT